MTALPRQINLNLNLIWHGLLRKISACRVVFSKLLLICLLLLIFPMLVVNAKTNTPSAGAAVLTTNSAANHVATPVSAPVLNVSDKNLPVLTLTDAVALTLRGNPMLMSAKLKRIADKYMLMLQHYAFQPQPRLIVDYNYERETNAGQKTSGRALDVTPEVDWKSHYGTMVKASYIGAYEYNNPGDQNPFGRATFVPGVALSITQPLLNGFGRAVVDAALNNAKDNEIINKLDFKQSVADAITSVVSIYLNLIQTVQELEAQKSQLQDNLDNLADANLRIKAGKLAPSDRIDFQSSVASSRVAIQNAENAVYTAKIALLNAIGLSEHTQFRLPKDLSGELSNDEHILADDSIFLNVDKSQAYALQHNTPYQTAVITLRLAARTLMVNRNARLPNLDFTVDQTANGEGFFQDRLVNFKKVLPDLGVSGTTTVSLRFTKLFDDVVAESAVVQAKVALQQANIALREQRRLLYANISNEIFTIHNQKAAVDLAQHAVELQQKNLEIANKKYRAGLVTSYNIDLVQQTLLTARTNLISARIRYLTNLATFAREINSTADIWNINIRY
ncbi:MAG: TolC family protein [Pseudomonadota bacterium]